MKLIISQSAAAEAPSRRASARPGPVAFVMIASDQRLKSARRSGAMPSISAMIVTGSGIESDSTRSKRARPATPARHWSTTSRTRFSHAAIRRGVKPRFTTLRMPEWRSPSSAIRLREVAKVIGFIQVRTKSCAMKRTDAQLSGGAPS